MNVTTLGLAELQESSIVSLLLHTPSNNNTTQMYLLILLYCEEL